MFYLDIQNNMILGTEIIEYRGHTIPVRSFVYKLPVTTRTSIAVTDATITIFKKRNAYDLFKVEVGYLDSRGQFQHVITELYNNIFSVECELLSIPTLLEPDTSTCFIYYYCFKYL